MVGPQLRDSRVEPVCITVPRVAGDEHVPSARKEIFADVIELPRAIGEPVEQHQRAFGPLPMRVQARVADRINVGSVEIL